ncbi:ammonium transporter [Oceanispirochaeta sp.]|jgi:Amt family ammonium transporter|uniref:ammonium transporter n=1 Tax=Oceanispirochaeta sp. TaxID=2035350 RepID=UPI002616B35E|nr:ammonium transporter [Oceanispirochaeta sp.]MDA3956113.1 ammonium transporter [Oceanispirochaeta sp.]
MKKNRKILIFTILALLLSVSVHADELTDTLDLYSAAFDAIWLLISGALVFFMQAGFAMVETGLTRAKNAGNIIMKNLMDFSAGAILYWAVGWGLMYGESFNGLFGTSDFFLASGDTMNWFFQVVFAATAATIVSGAMAERTKFSSYLIYSVVISGLIYPISGHWIWNGGWLSAMGFHDFAGSTVVHSVGAWAALMGAITLGPRIGKYVKVDGKISVKAIMGHNMPLAALGVFILWFGWYGFNAGSTLSGTDLSMTDVAVTTTLSAAAGAITAMFTTWIISGKPDVSMSLNGALAGLVGITAPCWVVSPGAAIIIGLVSGILVVASVEFIDKKLHIDDPVGAISVHGVCGAWGTLAVGIFGDIEMIGSGLTRGGQIGVQALGVVAVFLWVTITSGLLFFIIKKTIGLRVSAEEELKGLDIAEHGTESYAGFQIFQNI